MELIFYFTLLLVVSFSRGNEFGMLREEEGGNGDNGNNDNTIAFESFDTPVYGPNNIKSGGLNGKSAYNLPAPALAENYAAYLTSLGFGSPYPYGPYNRYNMLPLTYPSAYGYGSPLLSNPAYTSALMSGLGYASPYLGRSTYPGIGYGYPEYLSGLGYRYGGLGYPPEALRRGPAPVAGIPASVVGLTARAAPSAASFPAPVPAISNGIPKVAAVEPVVLPYGAPIRAVLDKDGVVRYGYASGGQNLPVY